MREVNLRSVVMEIIGKDGLERCEQFGDWSTGSSEHWDGGHRDSSGFGDWTSFEGLSEKCDSADLTTEGQTSGLERKVEGGDEPWIVIHDCFHVEETVRDTDMMDVLPLSQLLHNFTHTPPSQEVLLRNGANFYHSLLCEPTPPNNTKPNHHSHKHLTDSLELEESLQNTDLSHFGFEKPEDSSADLIKTKLTTATLCQNSPGFFYQISRQWLSQCSLRLRNHQDKTNLLY